MVDTTRPITLRFRVNEIERTQVELAAASAGQTVSQLFRSRLLEGLQPRLRYEVYYTGGFGDSLIGTLNHLPFAERIAKDYMAPDLDWATWIVDTATGETVRQYSSKHDGPGLDRVVQEK